jgi:hypothetical protein
MEIGCRFQGNGDHRSIPLPSSAPPTSQNVESSVGLLIDQLRSHQLPQERRAHSRVPYTERVGIRMEGTSNIDYTCARDLSKGGIALIATFPLPVQQICYLYLPQQQGLPLCLKAEVVRCLRMVDDFHDLALRFLSVESSDQPFES